MILLRENSPPLSHIKYLVWVKLGHAVTAVSASERPVVLTTAGATIDGNVPNQEVNDITEL